MRMLVDMFRLGAYLTPRMGMFVMRIIMRVLMRMCSGLVGMRVSVISHVRFSL